MSETKKSPPKHRARPKIRTLRLNRQAEVEHHMWAAQGLERPLSYRGRHAAEEVA